MLHLTPLWVPPPLPPQLVLLALMLLPPLLRPPLLRRRLLRHPMRLHLLLLHPLLLHLLLLPPTLLPPQLVCFSSDTTDTSRCFTFSLANLLRMVHFTVQYESECRNTVMQTMQLNVLAVHAGPADEIGTRDIGPIGSQEDGDDSTAPQGDAPEDALGSTDRSFELGPGAAPDAEEKDIGTFAGLSEKPWVLGVIFPLIAAALALCCCYFCLWPHCCGKKRDGEEKDAEIQAYPAGPSRADTTVDGVASIPPAGVPLAAGAAAAGGTAFAAGSSAEQAVIIPTEAKNLPPYTLVTPVETRRTADGATMVTPVQTRQVDGGMAITPVEAMSLDSDALVTPVETREEGGRTVVYPIGMKGTNGRDVGAQMLTGTVETVTEALR
ncbi:MAG: hypothetical protein HC767_01240 [Akkermansiaceae bacterium]|nr:hypothetical protein [Akkermansiaceae bacterium]